MITVAELWIYPVKSCGGIARQHVEVTPQGFKGDRQWMIVDAQGKFLTQRDYPQLARVQPQLTTTELTLTFDKFTPLKLPVQQSGKWRSVTIWRDQTRAIDQGREASQWFSEVLQTPCYLVRQSPEYHRPINPKYALWDNQSVSFADGYPILVTATASLDDLNQRLIAQYQDPSQAVPMDRFRPNVVIETPIPFMESDWSQVQINQVILALVKPCSRCLVTTTDQHTGDRHPLQEPLATLSRFRQVPQQGILFGENAIPLQTGILKLGDVVQILTGVSVNQ